MSEAPAATEQSLGQLVAAASRDMSVLIRSEIELAKLELSTEVKKAAVGGGALGGAGLFGMFALIMGSFAAAYGFAEIVPTWAAFLIVMGIYLFFALVFALVGRSAMKKLGPPERTVRTAKETDTALKTRGKAKKTATPVG
jgi:hypothetical protein